MSVLDQPLIKIEQQDFKDYPLLKKFLEIPDAPKQVYVLGKFPDPHLRTLAIVGSRKMTSYGKDVLEKIISGLHGYNICIISGLALGIDGESHKQALNNHLHTVGIPGSGLSKKAIYPKTNQDIAEKIVEHNSLLLSELEPDQEAAPWTFPARNRLMAALADAVLIVEASKKSGTMITARLALEYNKEVLAVPGNIFSESSEGANHLIAQGAKVVTCAEDVLEVFGIKSKNLDEVETSDLSEFEKKVLATLSEPQTKDRLLDSLDTSPSDLMMTLTLLEMRGYIKEEVGVVRRVK
jgi:DNA processing protein